MRALILCTLFLSIFISGCSPQFPCNNTCAPDQVCLNDSCVCPAYYEGVACNIPMLKKFVGTFNGNLSRNGQSQVTTFNIVMGGCATFFPDSVTCATVSNYHVMNLTIVSTTEVSLEALGGDSATQGTIFTDTLFKGVGVITPDGKNLKLSYTECYDPDSSWLTQNGPLVYHDSISCIFNGIKQ